MKPQIVVYGGAFNPPTIAHQAILQECVKYAEAHETEVWLLPSGERRDKHINATRETRLQYIDAMIADVDNPNSVPMKILTSELDRPVNVETYDTLTELNSLYPEYEFVWVFGADSTQTMLDWKEGQWLMDNVSMLLIERPGSVVNPAVKNWEPLKVPSLDVSSTQLRSLLAEGKDFRHMVTTSVHQLLMQTTALS